MSSSRRFPEGFLIGTASSAHQIEGAWNIDGKTENIWDKIVHDRPEKVADGSNADVSCDSYHLYKDDVNIIKELGIWTVTSKSASLSNPSANQLLEFMTEEKDEMDEKEGREHSCESIRCLSQSASRILDGRTDEKYETDGCERCLSVFDFYRFSISWARVLPTGEAHIVNELGVKYYSNLIDELLKNGIQPMVTMYHWDLPQRLQDLGGWMNPLIADYFEDYARILFKFYGDRVKWWNTINEPEMVAMGYGNATFAPCVNMFGYGEYLAAHHMILAHAKAYRMYEREFKLTQKGRISIALNAMGYFPKTNSKSDVEAAERAMQFQLGWFADPIYGSGQYPDAMRQYIDRASKAEGRSKSVLPTFNTKEVFIIKGSYDYFAFQHYTSCLASENPEGKTTPHDTHKYVNVLFSRFETHERSHIEWLTVVPEGFRRTLKWIKDRYGNPEVFVTECGYGDLEEHDGLEDDNRVNYYRMYLEEMMKAIFEDDCHITGFTAWSLLDNYEWFEGLRSKFGIVHVDFRSPKRKRTPKKSAYFFKKLIAQRSL